MQTSKQGKAEIASYEGASLTKYLDSVGVQTIGIGATVSEIPDIKQWAWDKELTLEQVFDLFTESLVKYENAVNKAVKVPLAQHQFDALVSICYNIGTGGLSKSTFVKRINNKESMPRIVDAIMMWDIPKEIIGRRRKEAKLFSTGVYSGNGTTTLFPVSPTSKLPLYRKGKQINCLQYL